MARLQLEYTRRDSNLPHLWRLLDSVADPEIPELSLWDLGVLRDIRRDKEVVQVVLSPTYAGCPALDVMQEDVQECLRQQGYGSVQISVELSPAWSTDHLGAQGRERLRQVGISPPMCSRDNSNQLPVEAATIDCPRCASTQTKLISEFGSTPCKAHYQCSRCGEPFDYFKPH